MKKSSALRRLHSLKEQLSAVGVSQLGLFGSTVRGENTVKVTLIFFLISMQVKRPIRIS